MCPPHMVWYLSLGLVYVFKGPSMLTFLKLLIIGQNSLSLNLSGYGSTPHDPIFQTLKAHLPGHLKITVLYPLLAYTWLFRT